MTKSIANFATDNVTQYYQKYDLKQQEEELYIYFINQK